MGYTGLAWVYYAQEQMRRESLVKNVAAAFIWWDRYQQALLALFEADVMDHSQ